jgi:hypothetical protein
VNARVVATQAIAFVLLELAWPVQTFMHKSFRPPKPRYFLSTFINKMWVLNVSLTT